MIYRGAQLYIDSIDHVNRRIGRLAMYLIFAMIAVLLWSIVAKIFFTPSLWTLETAQFLLVAYFVLGGPYSIQLGANVRMDLFYSNWSNRTKAIVDSITILCLIFYLCILFYGSISSTAYSLGHFSGTPFNFLFSLPVIYIAEGGEAFANQLGFLERSSTAWRPFLWPIKMILSFGIFLMILQCVAELLRNLQFLLVGNKNAA